VDEVSTVSSLPPDPPGPTIAVAAPLTVWSVAVFYEDALGLRGMVPQGPIGTPTELVRLCAPTCVKTTWWAAECWGAKPKLPSWDTISVNEVLVSRIRGAYVPGQVVDGRQVWHCQGHYVYQLQAPPGDNDNLTIGIGPYDPKSISVNYLSPNDFQRLFVGPSIAPSGSNSQLVGY
jgi:hypothetical protein